VFWLPKGAMVRNILETFWKEIHLARGYDLMYTPHIAKVDLWKTSGHYQHYAENMFDQMQVRTPLRSLLIALHSFNDLQHCNFFYCASSVGTSVCSCVHVFAIRMLHIRSYPLQGHTKSLGWNGSVKSLKGMDYM
jgi:glycyl-tRNA synthetase (class II)